MRSERKVVVCADDGGGAAGAGGWLVVVVEANEQAGGQVGWMTRGAEGELGGRKGPGRRVGKGLREKEFRQVWDRTRVNA